MSGEQRANPAEVGETTARAPDEKAKRERDVQYRRTFTELRNERFQQQTAQLRREHWLRLAAVGCVFVFVLCWLVFVGVVLVLAGVERLPQLTEKVLIALLGSTTVTVIGLLAIVVRYLFPANPAIFGHENLPSTRQAAEKSKKRWGKADT